MLQKLTKRMKGEGGFTLIELLVVIIIIAILAAIAIPTFLGQRQKAQDAAAKSLVRNAMTAIESQYIDTKTYASAAAASDAKEIEPSIDFLTTGTPATPTASAKDAVVDYSGQDMTDSTPAKYQVGTKSESGNTFWVVATKSGAGAGTVFMRNINAGAAESGW